MRRGNLLTGAVCAYNAKKHEYIAKIKNIFRARENVYKIGVYKTHLL